MDKDHTVSLGLAYLQDLRWAFIRSHAATVAVGVVPSFLVYHQLFITLMPLQVESSSPPLPLLPPLPLSLPPPS